MSVALSALAAWARTDCAPRTRTRMTKIQARKVHAGEIEIGEISIDERRNPYIAYGEQIAGAGSRHGGAQGSGLQSQLTREEEGRCATWVKELGEGTPNNVTGELSYGACP
jgi:hypothetical protein